MGRSGELGVWGDVEKGSKDGQKRMRGEEEERREEKKNQEARREEKRRAVALGKQGLPKDA